MMILTTWSSFYITCSWLGNRTLLKSSDARPSRHTTNKAPLVLRLLSSSHPDGTEQGPRSHRLFTNMCVCGVRGRPTSLLFFFFFFTGEFFYFKNEVNLVGFNGQKWAKKKERDINSQISIFGFHFLAIEIKVDEKILYFISAFIAIFG